MKDSNCYQQNCGVVLQVGKITVQPCKCSDRQFSRRDGADQ